MKLKTILGSLLALAVTALLFQNCSNTGFSSTLSSTSSSGADSAATAFSNPITQPTSESQFVKNQFGGHLSSFVAAVAPTSCQVIGDNYSNLVTHYPRLGDHEQANYNVAAEHFQPLYDFLRFGMPSPGRYIGSNFSVFAKSEPAQVEALLKKLCALGLNKVKFVQGAYEIKKAGDLSALVEPNVAYFQVLHGLVYKKNMFSVVVPPNWRAGIANQRPTLFNGFYDLTDDFLSLEGPPMFEILSQTYTDKGDTAFGILWNGNGAIGSRTLDLPAFSELDEFLRIYLADLGAASNKLVTFGISRGGVTAFNVGAHPLVSMKAAFVYSANPPYRLRDVGELTGPTVPLLLSATDWSVGFLNSWYQSFRHPTGIAGREDYAGLNGFDSHMKALTGTTSSSAIDADFNLITPGKIAKLKAAQTQIVLEVGSHDFICPSVDQFRWYQDAIAAGLDVEVRRNYLAGHNMDYSNRNQRLIGVIKQLLTGPYSASSMRFVTKALVSNTLAQPDGSFKTLNVSGGSPLTLEFPRYMIDEAPSHILATGTPGLIVHILIEMNGVNSVETLNLDAQGIAKLKLNNAKYPAGDYIFRGAFIAGADLKPKYSVAFLSTTKEPRGIVMSSLIGKTIPTNINASAEVFKATHGLNSEISYFNPGVPVGTNLGLLQTGDLQSISDSDNAKLAQLLNLNPPSCTYEINPFGLVAVGSTVTETIKCLNTNTNHIVKLIGTKDSAPQIDATIILSSGQFSTSTRNDGSAGLAGVYVRHLEVRSATTGAVLFKGPDTTRTLAALAAVTPSCTYLLNYRTNPVVVGEQITENITCKDLAVGNVVKVVGTKDAIAQINSAITLTNNMFSATTTNDGSAGLAGVYVRHIEIYSSAGARLYTGANVTATLAALPVSAPSCTYAITGSNPLAVGQSLAERVTCLNLPVGAIVKVVGTKDGVAQINEAIALINNVFTSEFANEGIPVFVGVYRRHIEIFSAAGAKLYSSPEVSQTILGTTCTHVAIGTNPVRINESITESISCSNVPAGASIKIISTKDGVSLVDTPIVLTAGQYSKTYTNNGTTDLAGTWTRRTEVYSSAGVLLKSTSTISVTFLPLNCSYAITGNDPVLVGGTATETATCGTLPTGATVKLYGTKDGVLQVNQVITLVNGRYSVQYTNDGSAGLSGTFRRRIEVYASDQTLLMATPYSQIVFSN